MGLKGQIVSLVSQKVHRDLAQSVTLFRTVTKAPKSRVEGSFGESSGDTDRSKSRTRDGRVSGRGSVHEASEGRLSRVKYPQAQRLQQRIYPSFRCDDAAVRCEPERGQRGGPEDAEEIARAVVAGVPPPLVDGGGVDIEYDKGRSCATLSNITDERVL